MNKPKLLSISKENVTYGENVTLIEPQNLYGCDLRDNVFVGPFVEIQSEVIVGECTKIQSHSFICSKVSIGKNCFIGHGVTFINDTFSSGSPAGGDKSLWRKTSISDSVFIGSNSTILPVKICSDVVTLISNNTFFYRFHTKISLDSVKSCIIF